MAAQGVTDWKKEAHDVSIAERLAMRQPSSLPVLAQLREKFLTGKEQLLPKHPMAEAVNYALGQWQELNVFCWTEPCPSTTM
jgi:hypothetical protein